MSGTDILKMKLKRTLYLGYYLKELDWNKFSNFLEYTLRVSEKSKVAILTDIVKSVFTYNISLLEYFQFRFYELDEEERQQWAGTGYMYEFQQRMNPTDARSILENKPEFMEEYEEFIRHDFATIDELRKSDKKARKLLKVQSGKLVLKRSDGGSGKGIQVIETEGLTKEILLEKLEASGNDMVEEYVVQHEQLMRLSPSGLNTVRIITQVTENNEAVVIDSRLRITVNSHVDNMAAGNIAAAVDSDTGVVISDAVYSDMTKDPAENHPATGVTIEGFQIPYWDETIQMVMQAALKNVSNRSIGWDVAITNHGPELIEGNHDWCKLLWQLPEGRGLKHKLERF